MGVAWLVPDALLWNDAASELSLPTSIHFPALHIQWSNNMPAVQRTPRAVGQGKGLWAKIRGRHWRRAVCAVWWRQFQHGFQDGLCTDSFSGVTIEFKLFWSYIFKSFKLSDSFLLCERSWGRRIFWIFPGGITSIIIIRMYFSWHNMKPKKRRTQRTEM